MLDSTKYSNDKAVISESLDVLRKLAEDSLSRLNLPTSNMDDLILRKVFKLFEKTATNKSLVCRESIDVSAELYSLVRGCQNDDPGPSESELSFLNLIAHNSTPKYALETLALWAPDYPSSPYLMPLLHIILQRGTQHGITREISGTLLRVRYARALAQGRQGDAVDVSTAHVADSNNVLRRMFDGSVAIEK